VFDGRSVAGIHLDRFSETPRRETLDSSSNAMRILSVRRLIQGQSYDLVLGTDLLLPTAILRRLWLLMLLSLPAVLLIASATGYWMSGRALAPVADLIAAARSIDSDRLSQRVVVPATGDEIQKLAETMNGMLARIEEGFRQARRFTANASHELRTPIAIIRAAAEVALLRSPASERVYRDALHRILRETERNTTLLENMLALARSDAGSDRACRQSMDLARSVAQVCTQMNPLADSKGLALLFQPHITACWIHADEDHVRRLLLVLIDNAVKYTPSGGRISVLVGEQEGRPFCTVTDSGIGISAEHLPRIFDRFYRVDKARSRGDGGSGLGLSIAHEIAKLHEAAIDVQSEPGRGSSFRVTFPAVASGRSATSAVAVQTS
jgi:heavy metal sensor kinase